MILSILVRFLCDAKCPSIFDYFCFSFLIIYTMKIFKSILAILLLLCLLDLPYGYYQLVRILAMMTFSYLAFTTYKNDGINFYFVTFLFLAILFQPLIKISLGRLIWNVVDIIAAIFLLYTVFLDKKNLRNK